MYIFDSTANKMLRKLAASKVKKINVDKNIAKHIGQRLALKSGLVGLLIAYLLFGWLTNTWDSNLTKAIFWIYFVEFKIHLLIGAIGLITMAYYFGQLAGVEILVKNRNDLLTGVKYGLLTLLIGTLIGSTVGFVQEGLDNFGYSNPFFDYYFKPLYWVTMFGSIPAILVGLWFGRRIYRQGQK
jgi:hypothetical protein